MSDFPTGGSDDEIAAWVFDWKAHTTIENMAGRSTHPIVDCKREYTEDVIEDFGVIEAHHEPTDELRALAVRLTHGSLTGFQIELGEYDLGHKEIEVLRRALVAYYHLHVRPT